MQDNIKTIKSKGLWIICKRIAKPLNLKDYIVGTSTINVKQAVLSLNRLNIHAKNNLYIHHITM